MIIDLKLKPCPFCGSEHIIAEIDYTSKNFVIYCEDCIATMVISFADEGLGDGSFMSFSEITERIEKLINYWNRRAV